MAAICNYVIVKKCLWVLSSTKLHCVTEFHSDCLGIEYCATVYINVLMTFYAKIGISVKTFTNLQICIQLPEKAL